MKTIKFTPAKLAGLKHPTGTHPEKWFDAGCEGLAIFVQPEPSLKKSYYAHWSKATIGKDGKKKTSGRYKYLGRFGGVKNLEAIKAYVVVNLPIWKAGNITTNSVKTVRSLRAEYKNAGAATGFRVKAKGTKIKYKKKTSDGYMGLLDTYVLANTVKESTNSSF